MQKYNLQQNPAKETIIFLSWFHLCANGTGTGTGTVVI